jgi:hypothetical protein
MPSLDPPWTPQAGKQAAQANMLIAVIRLLSAQQDPHDLESRREKIRFSDQKPQLDLQQVLSESN